jgi:hypothetical protein
MNKYCTRTCLPAAFDYDFINNKVTYASDSESIGSFSCSSKCGKGSEFNYFSNALMSIPKDSPDGYISDLD